MAINCLYDPLNRLTEANYSTGDYYHYTYDQVGNRLIQEKSVNGQASTVNYQYDLANRLINVDGMQYTWDNNGNLLNDGVNTYTYDSANRLSSVNNQSSASSYQYNGLGDRLTQNNTRYTLDLNAGLTQVLGDETNTYLYGVDRIAQANGVNTDYFLGDALGSTRKLIDSSGVVTLAQSYQPYGEELSSAGSRLTVYAFTGEMADPTGLLYLRARYYSGDTGRFLTRDAWDGSEKQPMSYNLWNYVQSNPVNYVDPTGHFRWECWGDNRRIATAEKYVPVSPTDPLTTYTAAGIAVQCWGGDWAWPWDKDNSGLGIAQVSNNQINTAYGKKVGNDRGYGAKRAF